uniref:Uncharacterized protein n=1 Tax=Arundo donax TaxID=35708 RepID=A0A0A9CQM9_ARUDO
MSDAQLQLQHELVVLVSLGDSLPGSLTLRCGGRRGRPAWDSAGCSPGTPKWQCPQVRCSSSDGRGLLVEHGRLERVHDVAGDVPSLALRLPDADPRRRLLPNTLHGGPLHHRACTPGAHRREEGAANGR